MKIEANEITYNLSIIKKVLKLSLKIMKKILPHQFYSLLYSLLRSTKNNFEYILYSINTVLICFFFNKEKTVKYKFTQKLLPYTMGGWRAMHNAYDIIEKIEKLNVLGAIVECGVARGGTSAMMAVTNKKLGKKERVKWLFDSYEGLPNPGPNDFVNGKVGELISPLNEGDCVGTEKEVRNLMLKKLKFDEKKIHFIKGWFENTIPIFKDKIGPIAVLRLDGDWYESTKIPLINLYDKISINGFIIIDDYSTCYGSQLAVDEFMNQRKLNFKLIPDGRGGVWFQKSF